MSNTLGEILKEYRIAKGLSTHDLKELTGVSQSYLSRIELQGLIPSPKILKKMASHLDLDYNELLVSAGYPAVKTELEININPSNSAETANKNNDLSNIIDLEELLLSDSYLIKLGEHKLTNFEKEKILAIIKILIK